MYMVHVFRLLLSHDARATRQQFASACSSIAHSLPPFASRTHTRQMPKAICSNWIKIRISRIYVTPKQFSLPLNAFLIYFTPSSRFFMNLLLGANERYEFMIVGAEKIKVKSKENRVRANEKENCASKLSSGWKINENIPSARCGLFGFSMPTFSREKSRATAQ